MQDDITFENPLLASAQRRRVDQMLRQDAGGVSGFGVVQRDGGTGRGFQPTDLVAMAEQVETLAGELQAQAMGSRMEDRIDNPEDYPNAYIQNEDGSRSTHLMAAEIDPRTRKSYAFPMIVQNGDAGMHKFTNPQEALQWNLKNGNVKEFNTIEEADAWSQNYKTDAFNEYHEEDQRTVQRENATETGMMGVSGEKLRTLAQTQKKQVVDTQRAISVIRDAEGYTSDRLPNAPAANVPIVPDAKKAQEVIDEYALQKRRRRYTIPSEDTEAYTKAKKVTQSGYTIGGFDTIHGSAKNLDKVLDVLTAEAISQATDPAVSNPITLQMIDSIREARELKLKGKSAVDFMKRNQVDFELSDSTLNQIVEVSLPEYEKILISGFDGTPGMGSQVFKELETETKAALVSLHWLHKKGPNGLKTIKDFMENKTDANYDAVVKEFRNYWGNNPNKKPAQSHVDRSTNVLDKFQSAYGADHQ